MSISSILYSLDLVTGHVAHSFLAFSDNLGSQLLECVTMAAFKKTNVKVYTKTGPNITPDTIYWKKLGVCSFLNCDLIYLDSLWL
jgi:hypothetical protein